MDGIHGRRKWKDLRQRLVFRAMGCCGGRWSPRSSSMIMAEEEGREEGEESGSNVSVASNNRVGGEDRGALPLSALVEGQRRVPTPASGSGMMNLAMALAAERNSREENVGSTADPKTLMKLIEETDGVDWMMIKKRRDKEKKEKERDNGGAENEGGGGGGGSDWVCCVCMVRSKGAAFIPCGHTFCRVCSRELWANRGSCPVCNRSIAEVLDIF